MKTKNGIYLDLKESEYYTRFNGIIFYFSSQIYLRNFISNVNKFVESETLKLKQKYKINSNFERYLQIAFYKKIEKRGFRIKIDDKELYENDDIIFTNIR